MIKFLLSLLFVLTSCNTFSRPICRTPSGSFSLNNPSGWLYVDLPSVVQAGKKYPVDMFADPKYIVECRDSQSLSEEFTHVHPVDTSRFKPSAKDTELNWHGKVVPIVPGGLDLLGGLQVDTTWNALDAGFFIVFSPGAFIAKNQQIGYLQLEFDEYDGEVYKLTLYLLAKNDIHVGGTCVPSTYNQNVTLDSYNPSKSSRKNIGLSVHCDKTTIVNYSLEGQLANSSDQSVFKNTAENGAKGIGIRFFNNGKIINKSEIQKIEIKGNSDTSLNLSTDYAVVKGESLTAGNVKSDVTVNLTYP